MKIVARYSHKGGELFISSCHQAELKEVETIIAGIDASLCKTKASKEKTMLGKKLYSPIALNKAFNGAFENKGWGKKKLEMVTQVPEIHETHYGFREMDFVKNKLGVEVQLGKYAFMVYNVLAKMTIFANRGFIDAGIEIVPMLTLAKSMSTGVSYFEQMKSGLEYRGESDIDIPVLIIGIDAKPRSLPRYLVN